MLTLPALCSTMFCDYYSLFKAILNKVYLYCTVNCIVSSFQKHSDLITMPGAGTDIQDWFRSLPFFTKYWFGGSVLFTLLGRFSLVNPYWLILSWETFITKYELTIITSCFLSTVFLQIPHLATDHSAFLLQTKFPLVDQPIFPLQLQVGTGT